LALGVFRVLQELWLFFICWQISIRKIRMRLNTILMLTYGVQKHESLVHHLQWACHTFIIVAKFIQNFLSPSLRKFNQERFWWFDIVSSDEEVSVIWWDLNDVITLSKLFTFFV
jgi:hypothetical protein